MSVLRIISISLLLSFPLLYLSVKQSTKRHIAHLLRSLSSTHLALSSTPRDRFDSILTVSLAIFLLLLKHLGLGPRIKTKNVREDGTVRLPRLSITAPISISKRELEDYYQIVRPNHLPSDRPILKDDTPLLLLTPLVSPLIPHLFVLRQSPIKPLGSVNVRNTFIFHRPDLLRRLRLGNDHLSRSSRGNDTVGGGDTDSSNKGASSMHNGEGEGMVVRAQMGGELWGRKMRRGVEFDTLLTVLTDSSTSNSNEKDPTLFSFKFTTLSLLSLPSAPLHPSANVPKSTEDNSTTRWYTDPLPLTLTANSPLLWARLSKDYNLFIRLPFAPGF